MTLVKGQSFQENKTRSLISEAIPSAKLVGNVGLEMSYILEEESTGLFKGLFEELEGMLSCIYYILVCHACV